MEETDIEHFRIFFWQKFVPLLTLPVFAGFLAISPVGRGWSGTTWIIAAAIVGVAVAAYLVRAWMKSDVILDETGVTIDVGGPKTWRYDKLLKVKQVGRYRVRMCFDPGIPDKHMHVAVDLWDSDAFVDALLDRYAESQGRELPELESHAA